LLALAWIAPEGAAAAATAFMASARNLLALDGAIDDRRSFGAPSLVAWVTRRHDPSVAARRQGSWHPTAKGRWTFVDIIFRSTSLTRVSLRRALPAGCHEPCAPEVREVVVAPRSKFHETLRAARRSFSRIGRRWRFPLVHPEHQRAVPQRREGSWHSKPPILGPESSALNPRSSAVGLRRNPVEVLLRWMELEAARGFLKTTTAPG